VKGKKRNVRVEEVGKRFDDGCDHTQGAIVTRIEREREVEEGWWD
jgi:hypothetical protein